MVPPLPDFFFSATFFSAPGAATAEAAAGEDFDAGGAETGAAEAPFPDDAGAGATAAAFLSSSSNKPSFASGVDFARSSPSGSRLAIILKSTIPESSVF